MPGRCSGGPRGRSEPSCGALPALRRMRSSWRRTVRTTPARCPPIACTRVLRVGIRELRNDVAAVVRRAAAGERIVVTVDGRPVAQLGPLEPTGAPTLDDLIASGHVVAARRAAPDDPPAVDAPVDARSDWILDDIRGG